MDIPENAPLRLCPQCLLELGFDTGPNDGMTPNEPSASDAAPATIEPGVDRYKLLQKIGEGGFGVVYMAAQEEPIRRRVALKVIKLGMDTRSVIARFEAERQALAMMDHPNIAKVLDAGQTDTGRPYFVMELVQGVRITDFCDENHLSTRERLVLFTQVCQAIQHAHQKGIIHRDIKPSNVLVTLHDGVPVPKVIDFGIAKAMHQQRLTDLTLFTAFGQFIGTPAYMSPEQAEMSGLDIDTRCDIYALGVLLYELLVGQVPFDGKQLLQAGVDEMRRIIREQEPPKPSTRLSTLTVAALTVVAKQRQCEAAKLSHVVRGDLDWIVMKCLEKDRTRRYETASGLAADIRRHLDNEPVIASPPSHFYRLQKMIRRNKLAFAATVAVAAVMLLGGVISAWQAVRAMRAERRVSEILYASDQFLAERALIETNRDEAQPILEGLNAAIRRQPENPLLLRARGAMSERIDKLDEAYADFSRAIDLAEDDRMRELQQEIILRRSALLRRMQRVPAAAMDYRRAKGLPYKHIPRDALPDYSKVSTVSIEFGATNREEGLYVVQVRDSKNSVATRDGEEAWFFAPGENYAYFFVDPTFKWTLSNAVVRVEYQGIRGNPIGLHYDGKPGRYSPPTYSGNRGQTGQWQIIEFVLHDTLFGNTQKGGADFRLHDNQNGFYLRRITVSPHQRGQIPRRPPSASSNQLDLTSYYNHGIRNYLPGADLATFTNIQQIIRDATEIDFDARGVVAGNEMRAQATNIPIDREVQQMHFLQSALFRERDGAQVGSYVIKYSDGTRAELPLIYGRNIRDRGDYKSTPEAKVVVWRRKGTETQGDAKMQLFVLTWINPRPKSEVKSVDVVPAAQPKATHLLAITLE